MAFPLWRAIFWISYAAWALFEIWVFARDRTKVAGRREDGGSIFVLIAAIIAAIFTAFWAPFLAPWARIAVRNPIIPAMGAMMIWGGIGFRFWAIQTLGRFFRTTVTIQDEHRLVTDGPYRILRHPAYTGAVITISGVGLFMNNWLSLLGAFAISLAGYAVRVRVEERALAARFGEAFRAQRRQSWAVIPFLW